VLVGFNISSADVLWLFLRKVQEEVLGGVKIGTDGVGTIGLTPYESDNVVWSL
jgi:hypothetical protein